MGATVSDNQRATVEQVFLDDIKGYVASRIYGIDCGDKFCRLSKAMMVLDLFDRADLVEQNTLDCLALSFLEEVPEFIDSGSTGQSDQIPESESGFQQIVIRNSPGDQLGVISAYPVNGIYLLPTLVNHVNSNGNISPLPIGRAFSATLCPTPSAPDINQILDSEGNPIAVVIEEGDVVLLLTEGMIVTKVSNQVRIANAPLQCADLRILNPDDSVNNIVLDPNDELKLMDNAIALTKVGDQVRVSSIPGANPAPHIDHDVFNAANQVVIQVAENETVKGMTAGMLYQRVGSQIQITAPPHADHSITDAENNVLETIDVDDSVQVIGDVTISRAGNLIVVTATGTAGDSDNEIRDFDGVLIGVIDSNDSIALGLGIVGNKAGDVWTFTETSNPILTSADANAGNVAAGQSVKMMSSQMTATLVSGIWQIAIAAQTVAIKDSSLATQENAVAGTDEVVMADANMTVTRGTAPDDDVLTIDVPTKGQPLYPYMHDYVVAVAQALDFSNIFAQYANHNSDPNVVRRKQLANLNDPFTLAENNEFENTSRYVNTAGTPMLRDSAGISIPDDFTGAINYVVIDTLYDVMVYMGNLGGPLSWSAAMDAIATNNTNNFAGYNDWVPLTPNIVERIIVPNKRQDADSGNNLLRKGAAGSGYNVAQERVWLGRSVDQQSDVQAWFHFVDTGAKVPTTKTVTSNHTTYMCRFMSQADYDALTTP